MPDPDLILLAYQHWGEDCARHLLGDFAFVLWDGERRRVLCARDHFGVKPLYYYRLGALLACASEIKALLALQTFVLESADRAAAAHGIEPRYPFFDVSLVEFCLSLPGNHKLRDGWTRWMCSAHGHGGHPAAGSAMARG